MSLAIPNETQQAEVDKIADETVILNARNKELKKVKQINLEGSKRTVITIEGGQCKITILDVNSSPPNVEIQLSNIEFSNSVFDQIISTIETDIVTKQKDLLERASVINNQIDTN